MDRVVLKYGGSSVANREKIFQVAERIIEKKREVKDVVVVVSAMGKTTEELLEKAYDINSNPSKRELDMLLTTGEQTTISLLAMAIDALGEKAVSLTGFQAGFHTSGIHGEQKIESIDTSRIEEYLKNNYIVIVAGFQGMDDVGDLSTLGRGGSDTSAVALAVGLEAQCEIYTDVEGIYTVDPRIMPEAKKLDQLSYSEALEISGLGSGVIAHRAVDLAQKNSVPLYIAINHGRTLGTYIVGDIVEKNTISNVSCLDDVFLFYLDGELSNEDIGQFLKKLGQENISIDVISLNISKETEDKINFSAHAKDKEEIFKILKGLSIDFGFKDEVSKVSLIGNAMRTQPGVAARAFGSLIDNDIPFYQVSTSEISISYIVDQKNKNEAVKALAKEFNL